MRREEIERSQLKLVTRRNKWHKNTMSMNFKEVLRILLNRLSEAGVDRSRVADKLLEQVGNGRGDIRGDGIRLKEAKDFPEVGRRVVPLPGPLQPRTLKQLDPDDAVREERPHQPGDHR